jgi:hypothetical protein
MEVFYDFYKIFASLFLSVVFFLFSYMIIAMSLAKSLYIKTDAINAKKELIKCEKLPIFDIKSVTE